MIHTVIHNVVRETEDGKRTIGNVYLTGAADAEFDQLKRIPDAIAIDVRGLIDSRYSKADNIYGCLKIALEIEDALRNGKNPVVFCDGGLERSPLAVAVWFSWTHNVDMDFAYEHIKRGKPDIFRRDEWIH